LLGWRRVALAVLRLRLLGQRMPGGRERGQCGDDQQSLAHGDPSFGFRRIVPTRA
jgi:hypothetical protein